MTGTYNRPGTYKIVYRVNGGGHRTLADNLSTQKNYTLAASATALKLASNERVTEIMFVFGQAPAGFAQVEKPYLHCKAVTGLSAGSFVNVADVGGTYGGTWVQGISVGSQRSTENLSFPHCPRRAIDSHENCGRRMKQSVCRFFYPIQQHIKQKKEN